MKTFTVITFLILLISNVNTYSQDILVISGGGARGAWGGGVAEALYKEKGKNHEIVIGTSTGSLLAPFIISKDFETLRDTYTNVGQRDIFSINPFKKNGDIKKLNAIFRIILGKKTLGESKKLRRLLDEKIPMDIYQTMLDSGNFIVTVVNFVTGNIHYFSSKDFDPGSINCENMEGRDLKRCEKEKDKIRNQMLDWIWASGNQPVLMSLYETPDSTNGKKEYWVDGGVRENIALLQGLNLLLKLDNDDDNDTLDVIINNTKDPQITTLEKPKIINSLFQTIDIFSYDARYNDVRIPGRIDTVTSKEISITQMLPQYYPTDEKKVHPKDNIVVINLYYMDSVAFSILPQSLLFKKDEMTKLWNLGLKYTADNVESYPISRDYATYLVETEFTEEEKISMEALY